MKSDEMGKFEIFTIVVLIIAVFSYIAYYFINNSESQKLIAMRKSAESFAKVTSTNRNYFHNRKVVYLGEVIEEGYISNVMSPFSKGECSKSESKIEFNDEKDNNDYTITLKCDNYLIDQARVFEEKKDIKIYKVGEWLTESTNNKNEEKKTLYNCLDGGKNKYPEFYEELYFVSRINFDYGTDHNDKSTIGPECPIVEKTLYRTKELVRK